MSKKKSYNPFKGAGYEKFNALSQQLQRENAMLLKERSKIVSSGQRIQSYPSQNTIKENDQFSIDQESQQNVQLPHFQVAGRTQNVRKKNQRRSVRQQIVQRGSLVSDDVMEMIDEIEKKALAEIESLRADKISLLKRLNTEIKSHNAEKKKTSRLEKKNINLTQPLKKSKIQRKRIEQRNSNIIYEQEEQNSPSPGPSYIRNHEYEEEYHEEENEQIQPQNIQPPRQKYPAKRIAQPRNTNFIQQPRSVKRVQLNQDQFQNNQPQLPPPPPPQPARKPNNIINSNVVPSQSFYYLGNQPAKINAINNFNPEAQIQNQINRLRAENANMRNTLSRNTAVNTKAQLKNELLNLENKAQRYRQMIQKARNMSGGPADGQMETLFLQGTNLAQEGQRLMKVRSNPQLRSTIGATRAENQQGFSRNITNPVQMGSKTNIDLQRSIQTPIANSRQMKFNNNSRFSPGEYESILANMQRAVNS